VNCHGRFYFVTMMPPSFPSILPAALNHLLAQEQWARDKLAAHAGKIAVIDAGLITVRLQVTPDGLVQAALREQVPNVTIRASIADVPLIMQNRERAFSYVKVEGDADFANTISQLSQSLRWEAEEDLSKWVGDIAATRIADGARAAFDGVKSTQHRLAENIAEYFIEENPMLVRPQAVADFTGDVNRLRDDVERLAKRIEKLESRIK
jgi:ubiquinone biosynthesis protein UbiJ